MSYDGLFAQALNDFDNGRFSEAEALLRQIYETAPDNPDVLNLLGLIAQAQGIHNEACSYFAAAIRQNSQSPSFYYNLAFSLKAIGQYTDALSNFNKVLRLAPTVKEAHNEIACIYEHQNELEKARFHWNTALAMDNNYSTAKINLANSYRADTPLKAEQELQNLSKEFPNEALVWYDLAWATYNTKNYASALEYSQKAFDLASSNDAVCYQLGIINSALDKITEAEKYFRSAETLNDYNFEAKLSLADILSRTNRFDEAEQRYRRLKELNPHHFDTRNNYAEMLYRQKRLAESLEEYRQAVIINPHSAEVSNNLGAVLKDIKEYDEALGLFFNALSIKPEMSAISINISETLILLATEDIKHALQWAENWKKSYPANPFALHILAALQGENIENNQIYTEKLFDNFADNYELVMQNLDYSAPMAIRRIAGTLVGRIADLGCGSGLIGQAVKNDRNQIIGVDISAKMLEQASQKNIYTELVKSDITDFLRHRSDFEWIIAGDVVGYMGNLDEFIKLASGKNLIFSIEKSESASDYQIQPSGRFKHNPLYIEKLLQQNGFYDISKEELALRNENSLPVLGCIYKAFGQRTND